MAVCRCDCGEVVEFANRRLGHRRTCGRCKSKLVGTRRGKVVVLDCRQGKVLIRCDCGTEKWTTNREAAHCGCSPKTQIVSLIGQRFTRLEVLARGKKERKAWWICLCDCGNTIETRATSLKNGDTKSCGCLKAEQYPGIGKKRTCKANIKRRYAGCVICDVPKPIDLHHMDGRNIAKDKIYQSSNLAPLCKTHHDEFHMTFGYGWNTVEQFMRFCISKGC